MYDAWVTTPLRFGDAMATQVARVSGAEARPRQQRALDVYTPLDPAHVLISMLMPIGDTLFATPALAAVKRRFPWAKITVLASRSNSGILRDNPNVGHLILADDPGPGAGTESRVLRLARGLTELRHQKYDLVINLSPVGGIVLMMAGVYQKPLAVEKPALWWLIGGHSDHYRALHAIEHYLRAIAPILDHPLSEEERQPRLYLTAKDRSAARRLLRERGLSPADLLVTMHVGADGFNGRKRWAPKRFAEVARHLIDRFNARVLLVGGKDDIALSEEVATLTGEHATVVAGLTSLKETSALIEMSALFIGNDSCPLHIAAAVGTPAVGIYGPSNAEQFRPVGKRHYRQRLVRSDLPCSPCFHFVGNDAPWVPNTCYSYACLKSITAERVIEAAIELLRDERTR